LAGASLKTSPGSPRKRAAASFKDKTPPGSPKKVAGASLKTPPPEARYSLVGCVVTFSV
jgi:hypothetical protein